MGGDDCYERSPIFDAAIEIEPSDQSSAAIPRVQREHAPTLKEEVAETNLVSSPRLYHD